MQHFGDSNHFENENLNFYMFALWDSLFDWLLSELHICEICQKEST